VHHVVLERWSRGSSPLHRRDARAKLVAVFLLLVLIATGPPRPWLFASYGLLLGALAMLADIPLGALIARAALVLPFSAVFAVVSWTAGDPQRAWMLCVKSYLSALAVLLTVALTPLPELLRALGWFRVPALLITVTQFLYRYLFVLSEQAQHMRLAARCRGGRSRIAAAGAVATLFARSYARAEGIHHAMLARGFSGQFPAFAPLRFRGSDALFLAAGIVLCAGLRVALG
jgi:cobalt/nickel transport system permease protein